MKHFYLILFCSLNLLIAQTNSGVVEYQIFKKNINQNVNKPIDKGFKAFSNGIEEKIVSLKFNLVFNKTEAHFSLIKNLALDSNNLNTEMAILLVRGKNVFYTNLKNNNFLESKEFLDKKFIIKRKINTINWELTKEEKTISSYKCFKAIGKRSFKNKEGETDSIPLTAWYCPSLAFNFGPYEAVGLPGLVLEFHAGQFIFAASKLNFKEEDIDVPSIKFDKSISASGFDKIAKKKIKEID